MAEVQSVFDIVVFRDDSRGARFAVRVPYRVDDGVILIDHHTAGGAAELLRSAADEHFGGPPPFPAAKKKARRRIALAEAELPDWDDLRGCAPDATGGLSSEDFVRELRNNWSQS